VWRHGSEEAQVALIFPMKLIRRADKQMCNRTQSNIIGVRKDDENEQGEARG
jgi:hypothetical protein